MNRLAPLLLVLAACAATPPAPRSLDDVFGRPEGELPFRFAFSHDGEQLAYLKRRGKENLTDLWVYDLAKWRETGELDKIDVASGEKARFGPVFTNAGLLVQTTLAGPGSRRDSPSTSIRWSSNSGTGAR